jgi:hypothetical protein
VSTRDGETLNLRIPEFVDGSGHYSFTEDGDLSGVPPDVSSARLYRDGALLAEAQYAWGAFAVPPSAATYRLELSVARSTPEWQYATRTETAWTFRSGHTERALLPLLQVDYAVDTSLSDEARGVTRIGFTPRHQDGLPAPDVRSVQAWLSCDDGRTWTELRLDRHHRTTVHHRHGKDFATLRVRATDRQGNAVEQTVVRAFGWR